MTQAGIASLQLDETEQAGSCTDIFAPPLIESDLIEGNDIEINTISAITNAGP